MHTSFHARDQDKSFYYYWSFQFAKCQIIIKQQAQTMQKCPKAHTVSEFTNSFSFTPSSGLY